jgi:hypothetical protein
MHEHHAAVQQLSAQGLSKAAIRRKLGPRHATVRKFATARSVDDLIAKTEQRAHLVDAWTAHLHRRWNESERNATAAVPTHPDHLDKRDTSKLRASVTATATLNSSPPTSGRLPR